MADPYRLLVLKRMTALLETMTIADGYPYNLAGCVHRGRTIFGDETVMPFVSILEAPRPGFSIYAGDETVRSAGWDLLVQGFCEDDLKNPSDPLYVFADAVSNIFAKVVLEMPDNTGRPAFPEWHYLGRNDNDEPLISSFTFGPPVIRAPDATTMTKACFYMPVNIGTAREVGSPTSNAP